MALPYLFEFWALEHQIPPLNYWKTWIVLGGRGAGKTRAGAEWVRSQAEGALPETLGAAKRIALISDIAWLRRGRVDADLWHEGDIPLAEAAERYRVRILAQSEVLREAYPERPVRIYENAWYISDLAANNVNGLRFEVAQLSDRFGPGPSAYMIIPENLEIKA